MIIPFCSGESKVPPARLRYNAFNYIGFDILFN